jgi:hypothetical protein
MKNNLQKEHDKDCECDSCWRKAIISRVDKWIEEIVKENPGEVCPFCGTNPSKPAVHGTGWLDFCGHEVRKNGLVIGWRKSHSKLMKCICPEKTRQRFVKNFRKY